MPAVRSPGLKVRTPASQAGDDGFEPRRSVEVVVVKHFCNAYG